MEIGDQAPTSGWQDPVYVKVFVRGCRVGRNINLKAYPNYYSLSRALHKLYYNFLTVNYEPGQVNMEEIMVPDSLVSTELTLLYEDQEGNEMLVGDIPYEDFVTQAKKLLLTNEFAAPQTVVID